MDTTESEKLQIATKTKLGVATLKNTSTINVQENSKIKKVLTASAKVMVENITPLNAEVKFDGFIEYNLLVVLEDNSIEPLTQKSKFSHNFESPEITTESTIIICSNLLECDNISNNVDGVTYSAVVNFDILEVKVNSSLSCASYNEDVYVKENKISYSQFIGQTTHEFNLNFNLEQNGKISKILYVINNAYIKSVVPANNYFVASGEVVSFVTYLNEEGIIKSLVKQNSFSEEIEFNGINKETNIQVCIQTKETTIISNAEENVFSFDVPLNIVAQFFNKNELNCVVDAYNLKNEVNLTTNSFKNCNYFSTHLAEENILTTFTLTSSMQPIDKLLAVSPINTQIINVIPKNGEVLVEGIATINVVYYFEDDDNTNILNSIDVEVPYSLNVNVPEILETDYIYANIVMSEVNIKNKRGKELEILAEVKVNYNFQKEENTSVTTQIVIGEEKPQKDYALEIYVVKQNQTLWDIAKELNISSQELLLQNQNLTLPLKVGDKIISYNCLQPNLD